MRMGWEPIGARNDERFRTRPDGLDMRCIHSTFLAFPIACFSLTVATDVGFVRTVNLLWLHFSEWLLLTGLIFGVLAAFAYLVDYFICKLRPHWLALTSGIVVLLLAAINSFVHTADGWTAVVPYGLTLSVLTVVAMIVTAWFGRMGARHV